MRTRPVIAIDGPAGAGKSTLARRIASHFGYTLVDTGAIYRAIAYGCTKQGTSVEDDKGATAYAEKVVADRALEMHEDQGVVRMVLYGEDVSAHLRTPEMGMGASTVSKHPGVRAALLDVQRMLGLHGGVVLEGRDIGSVVFPDAEVKFFLTASAEIRAERRHLELSEKGMGVSYEQTLADVTARDAQDEGRAAAPLKQTEDAIRIDSSKLTLEEVVQEMIRNVQSRIG